MPKELHRKIEAIINRPKTHPENDRILSGILKGLSLAYGVIVRARNGLYDKKILTSRQMPCFVISVGNITVGGTGKTPMACYLANCLKSWGYKTAVITRGYGGGMEKKGGVISDGNRILTGPDQAGDEPYMMAKTLEVPVIAGKNRYRSARIAVEQFSAQVLILDDGFQHRKVQRHFNLVLMDSRRPTGNGFLLPRGPLREPVSGMCRSDAVIFTRASDFPRTDPDIYTLIQGRPVFQTCHVPFVYKHHAFKEPNPAIRISRLKGKTSTLFSGIAGNSGFRTSCEDSGMVVDAHLEFEDHHTYTPKNIETIISAFNNFGSDLLVTTHKDYTKLKALLPAALPLVVLDVKIEFKPTDEPGFHACLRGRLNAYFERKAQ